MAKLKLPPQGGEKWLCIFTFLFMMFSVLCTVSVIYCIVIIYIPSMEELQTDFQGPKRCTTSLVERNITSVPGDGNCDWASCEEWCLSQGSSPCSKMYGILREIGASVTYEQCDLEPEGGFVDHLCTTLDDLEAVNCKRSKREPENPGNRELCVNFNTMISCEKGYCKNVSRIYDCIYKDMYQDLLNKTKDSDGFCNCNRCTTSNTSIPGDCPKETAFCFAKGRNPEEYDEKEKLLCAAPTCQNCYDICKTKHQCLDMNSRRDVVYFGVDEYDDPMLTYYDCKNGVCTEIYDLICNRTCDHKKFDFNTINVVVLQGERLVMSKCRKMFINGTVPIPLSAVSNNNWNILISSCSNVSVDRNMKSIQAEDCLNGTWVENMGIIDYNTITRKYLEYRHNPDRWVKNRVDDEESVIPWEEHIVIYNQTKIKKNQQGCVNTLSMECMDFFARFARDGANYTARAVFDCYYNPEDTDYVVIDYQPERTFFFLLMWSVIPGSIMVVSCLYMCICSRFIFIGDDGHMRIICCGNAVTGIGNVAVYTPPTKSKS
ncbi:uncharacterized protein LOC111696850 [Eurytemora carolleeae]|uniref:uncharacterized protein LOC111696850 n=1 Tax=Eurytemora carolleeae TaxID=1294199 RepID=UPI000C78CBD0|nr:uncharacterized protein LOC111696850 [Eurytemora carolleeae]|eukprot:XP_023322370.1 uncharacterized protein LOC111696850 [Eurytemora affinis]